MRSPHVRVRAGIGARTLVLARSLGTSSRMMACSESGATKSPAGEPGSETVDDLESLRSLNFTMVLGAVRQGLMRVLF
jgi:hypothetical protein